MSALILSPPHVVTGCSVRLDADKTRRHFGPLSCSRVFEMQKFQAWVSLHIVLCVALQTAAQAYDFSTLNYYIQEGDYGELGLSLPASWTTNVVSYDIIPNGNMIISTGVCENNACSTWEHECGVTAQTCTSQGDSICSNFFYNPQSQSNSIYPACRNTYYLQQQISNLRIYCYTGSETLNGNRYCNVFVGVNYFNTPPPPPAPSPPPPSPPPPSPPPRTTSNTGDCECQCCSTNYCTRTVVGSFNAGSSTACTADACRTQFSSSCPAATSQGSVRSEYTASTSTTTTTLSGTATSDTQSHRIQALCLSALAVCVTLLV